LILPEVFRTLSLARNCHPDSRARSNLFHTLLQTRLTAPPMCLDRPRLRRRFIASL
jgi:hypothetical protein